jgi:thiamine pyrophosphate-dependent acetolactate synthase large subunit-like protein
MAAGVKRVYGVVGDSLNPVVDGIRRAAESSGWGCELARANVRNIRHP